MVFCEVDIDLLFARVECKEVSPNLSSLSDHSILRGVDSATVKSLNGRRATDAIIDAIPEGRMEAF